MARDLQSTVLSAPTLGGSSSAAVSPGRRRTRLVPLAVVALSALAAAGCSSSSSSSTTTTPAAPATTPESAAYNLASSINLQLSDLPSGWQHSTAAGVEPATLNAAQAAVATANQTLGTCVGQPTNTVAALLGSSAPGQVAIANSEIYQNGSDAGEQMSSQTRVMGSNAEAQALAAPFASPNFVTCFAAYETTLAAAAIPGSTAQVQPVTLVPPSGAQAYGYVTTLTVPGKGTFVLGDTYIVGGTVMSRLTPQTTGAPIPSAAFQQAFTAVAGRVAKQAG